MPERTKIGHENVEELFTYHTWNEEQTAHGVKVREALVNAATVILDEVPDSPDRTVAIRKLREARMDCNSAITHDGKF